MKVAKFVSGANGGQTTSLAFSSETVSQQPIDLHKVINCRKLYKTVSQYSHFPIVNRKAYANITASICNYIIFYTYICQTIFYTKKWVLYDGICNNAVMAVINSIEIVYNYDTGRNDIPVLWHNNKGPIKIPRHILYANFYRFLWVLWLLLCPIFTGSIGTSL